MEQKTWLVKTGDFFFKYRNFIFPALMVSLFATNPPPSEYLGSETLEGAVDLIAVAMVLAGLALRSAVIGYRYIKRGGLNKKVYAADLVTDGFFSVCRNPLYVGNFLIYAGVLLKHGSPFVFFAGLAFFAFVYTAIVAAEEFFLRTNFGDAYSEYCRDVPRWRMRWSRLKQATEGMKFNLKRAIIKDYSTITNGLVTLIALELWEEVRANQVAQQSVDWPFLGGMMGAVIVIAISIRIAKKRGYIQAT